MEASQFARTAFGEPVREPGQWGFTFYRPSSIPRDLHLSGPTIRALSEADAHLGLLNGLGQLIDQPELLIGPFLAREALASSRIEGTNASLSEVLQAQAADGATEATEDVREVGNYLAAARQGARLTETLPITQRLIVALHRTLMTGVRGQERAPGELRTSPVWIGGPMDTPTSARFVPPLPRYIPELLSDWERYVNATDTVPTLIRCALMHYQFETIHPFLDGNGRIGRLLVGLMLTSENRLSRPLLYLSGYLETHRAEYYARLQAVRETGAVEPYLVFFLTAVLHQSRDAVARAQALVRLRETYLTESRLERSRVAALIPLIFGSPFLTTRRVERSLNVTGQGARNLLSRAQGYGWVEPVGSVGRGGLAMWVAPRVLEVLERPMDESARP